MMYTRRDMFVLGAGAGVFALTGGNLAFAANEKNEKLDAAVNAFTGGAELKEGVISLDTPEIAENGNTVPVSFSAEDGSQVTDVILFADANPSPDVAHFTFGGLAVAKDISTRIRLSGTQNVIAIAKTADGGFYKAQKAVKVTIGGCGG